MTSQDRVNGGRPGDVLVAAKAAMEAAYHPAKPQTDQIIDAVCNAIEAERERCAKIAESHGGRIRLGGFNAWHGASTIAAAIRKGGA